MDGFTLQRVKAFIDAFFDVLCVLVCAYAVILETTCSFYNISL